MYKKFLTSMLLVICFLVTGCSGGSNGDFGVDNMIDLKVIQSSQDGYVKYSEKNKAFVLGTDKIEQVVELNDGVYGISSIKNKQTKKEYIAGYTGISFIADGKEYSGKNLELKYVDHETKALSHGEIELKIKLVNKDFEVIDTYTIFPQTSVIKNNYQITPLRKDVELANPQFAGYTVMPQKDTTMKLIYFTGGGNFTGSQEKVEIQMSEGFEKTMVSHEDREVKSTGKGYKDDTQDVYNGYSAFLPYFVIEDIRNMEGIYFGFEYAGLWKSEFKQENGSYTYRNSLNEFSTKVKKGTAFVSPTVFHGVYAGNIDDAGNDVLLYQYEYMWDYIGDIYPLTFTDTWTNHIQSFNGIVELIENARYLGLDMVHIDDNWEGKGWFDKKGDWNVSEGFNLKHISDYLNASNMKSSVWMAAQHYDISSDFYANTENEKLFLKDADGDLFDSGYYGPLLCVGNDDTIDFMKDKVTGIINNHGVNMIKMDGWMMAPCFDESHGHGVGHEGCDAVYKQYHNYMKYLKDVMDSTEDFYWHVCASGGELDGFDMLQYATVSTTTDGLATDPIYNMSHIFPSGKFQSGYASLNNYTVNSTRTYGFIGAFHVVSDISPSSPNYKSNMDKMQKDISLYKYLREQGVLGRYSRQYHLSSPLFGRSVYMKTNKDQSKAVIMGLPENVEGNYYPVGLKDDVEYTVSFYSNSNTYTAKGAHFKKVGIKIPADAPAGEMIFFNILNTPNSGRDTVEPVLSGTLTKKAESFTGKTGVALYWEKATDDNWIDHYLILDANNVVIDKVASGTFWFKAGANASATYKVVAVDGDGNRSAVISA